MKVIVAGSRDVVDPALVAAAIEESGFNVTEVVSGAARGVDRLGEQWADRRRIPIRRFRANWSRYDKAAGSVRNQEMAEYGQGLVAVWDGVSPGTADMIERARRAGLRVYVKRVGPPAPVRASFGLA